MTIDKQELWRRAHPERVREHKRKWKMLHKEQDRITRNAARNKRRKETVLLLLKLQGDTCALCASSLSERSASIDHCHKCRNHRQRFYCAMCIRGALCRLCNYAVGYVESRKDLCVPSIKLSEYLKKRPLNLLRKTKAPPPGQKAWGNFFLLVVLVVRIEKQSKSPTG